MIQKLSNCCKAPIDIIKGRFYYCTECASPCGLEKLEIDEYSGTPKERPAFHQDEELKQAAIKAAKVFEEEGKNLSNSIEFKKTQEGSSKEGEIKIERQWAMPSKWTFTIFPIKKLLKEEVVGSMWVDPFAGRYSPANIKNDLNPSSNAETYLDALEFLKSLPSESFNGVLFDPPYSITQARECYEGFGMEKLEIKPTSMQYWAECRNEISRILKRGGKAICCGWTSQGLGKNRGFQMQRILMVPHGGSRNDTIVTVEFKL